MATPSLSGLNITELKIKDNLDNIQDWRMHGFTNAQIARKLGITKTQLYIYLHRIPELKAVWDSGDKALLQDLIIPSIVKFTTEGFKYTEVTRELNSKGKMHVTKEVDKTQFNIGSLFSLAAKIDPERWGKKSEEKEEVSLELDDSLDFIK